MKIRKAFRFLVSPMGLVTWIAVTAVLQIIALLVGGDLGTVICGGFFASTLLWVGLLMVTSHYFPKTTEERAEEYRRLYGGRAPYSGLFNVSSDSDDDSDGQEE